MKRKILFSPLGGTDPISNFFDGSMLHICRVYQPDLVYLYLSHEMCNFHNMDNRYLYCLEKLGEKINHNFQHQLIMKEQLKNVQEFDVFYEEFHTVIREIMKDMDETDVLYLNVSSGTPAMKSALLVMATLAEYRFIPIQVTTPTKGLNKHDEDRERYDVVTYWELNQDNQVNLNNRCREVKSSNLIDLMKIDMVKKHILAYDYVAALTIANEMKNKVPEEVIRLLNVANHRLQLNISGVDKWLQGLEYDIIPIKSGDRRALFEYAMILDIKLIKKEYADFIRAITPIVADLLELIVKEKCKISVDQYCTIRKDKNGIGVRKWDIRKLKGSMVMKIFQTHFKGNFRGDSVASYTLHILINKLSEDSELIKVTNDIIKVEQEIRNFVAHEIVSVTNEWIEKRTGFTGENIIQKIKYLMNQAGLNIKKEDWKSYDVMNQIIIDQFTI